MYDGKGKEIDVPSGKCLVMGKESFAIVDVEPTEHKLVFRSPNE